MQEPSIGLTRGEKEIVIPNADGILWRFRPWKRGKTRQFRRFIYGNWDYSSFKCTLFKCIWATDANLNSRGSRRNAFTVAREHTFRSSCYIFFSIMRKRSESHSRIALTCFLTWFALVLNNRAKSWLSEDVSSSNSFLVDLFCWVYENEESSKKTRSKMSNTENKNAMVIEERSEVIKFLMDWVTREWRRAALIVIKFSENRQRTCIGRWRKGFKVL